MSTVTQQVAAGAAARAQENRSEIQALRAKVEEQQGMIEEALAAIGELTSRVDALEGESTHSLLAEENDAA